MPRSLGRRLLAAGRPRRPTASASRRPDQRLAEHRRAAATARRRSMTSPSSTIRWSTRPVSVITTISSRAGVERDHLEVPHRRPGQRRVLHDRDLPGQLGEQPDRAAQHVVEVDRRRRKHWIARRSAADSGLTSRQPVDEQPVALVGRDPTGAGVRLGDVALVLQHRHVVADGRAGHAQVVPLDQRSDAPAPGWPRSRRRWRADLETTVVRGHVTSRVPVPAAGRGPVH